VQHIDIELTRVMAYQEGLMAGQRLAARDSSSTFYLAALTGAAFAAGAAAMLMRAKVTSQ
jgi:hypothetical protein